MAFEGGVHGDSSLKVQEILLLARTLDQGLKFCSDLKEALKKKNIDTDVGLEGGFSPNNISDEQALEILVETFSKKAKIGLDFGGRYFQGQSETQDKLITSYPVFLAEDPFSEEDFKNWSGFFRKFGKKYLVVGDDLVATNVSRLKKNLKMGLINAVIVKPNQIGTVTDTLNFVKQARKNNLTIIVSHRSGETNDPFIADLAWAVSADYVKFGGLARGERIAKYNRLKELVLGSR